MKAPLYTLKNETVGDIDLSPAIFGVAWKPDLVHQAVVTQQANLRRPWAHVKERDEVRGGGKKPWRQKGTGRARHGSTRSPIWVGGGKSHGPRNDRDYSKALNKKMRRTAILSILSKKLSDNSLRVVQDFVISEPKTKILFASLAPFLGLAARSKKLDTLIIRNPENTTITRVARNLVKTKVLAPQSLNAYDLMNYKTILVDAGSLPALAERYSGTANVATPIVKEASPAAKAKTAARVESKAASKVAAAAKASSKTAAKAKTASIKAAAKAAAPKKEAPEVKPAKAEKKAKPAATK